MGGSRLAFAVRYFDVVLLVAALPVFLAAGLPMLAYAVVAVIWAVSLLVEAWTERHVRRELAAGNRRDAMGWTAATALGRVWTVALAVLIVGLLDERETGLAAAVLAAILFTVHLAGRLLARAMTPPGERL
ncbi:MAG: hypothetical protein FJW90_09635 [Actinobacteria bacterium]|nr:hypothetical protein [Actinomycetota bacterium]